MAEPDNCPKKCEQGSFYYCHESGTHCDEHCICPCEGCEEEQKKIGKELLSPNRAEQRQHILFVFEQMRETQDRGARSFLVHAAENAIFWYQENPSKPENPVPDNSWVEEKLFILWYGLEKLLFIEDHGKPEEKEGKKKLILRMIRMMNEFFEPIAKKE